MLPGIQTDGAVAGRNEAVLISKGQIVIAEAGVVFVEDKIETSGSSPLVFADDSAQPVRMTAPASRINPGGNGYPVHIQTVGIFHPDIIGQVEIERIAVVTGGIFGCADKSPVIAGGRRIGCVLFCLPVGNQGRGGRRWRLGNTVAGLGRIYPAVGRYCAFKIGRDHTEGYLVVQRQQL